MANTRVCPYYMADTVVCHYHSLLAVRYSLIANRQSLPFSVVADSLMADTVVCPYYMADTKVCPYYSLFATRCRSSSRQSLITSRCLSRHSLFAAVLAIR
jgi:hypothetical protein